MTTAEKLTQVAKNVDKVYSAGQSSMVDENKIREKTVSGVGALHLNDVSEIPHKIDCKVESLNLFNIPDMETTIETEEATNVTFFSSKGVISMSGIYEEPNSYGALFSSIGTCIGNYATSTPITETYGAFSLPKGTYTFYADETQDEVARLLVGSLNASSKNGDAIMYKSNSTFTVDNDTYALLCFQFYTSDTIENFTYTVKPMLNRGTEALPYTPYVNPEDVTVTVTNDDGSYEMTYTYETIKDMVSTHETSPIMNIQANADVNIEVTYNRSYGMQTEYDRFWDTFYNRSSWAYAFYGVGWTDVNYNPPKSIEPAAGTNAISMFHNALITDTKVPIKLSGATGANTMFYGCSKLETIRSITFGTSTLTNTFYSCTSLKNIEITEKCVVQNIDLHWSTLLTKDSIISIINALSDTVEEMTLTISKIAINNAFGIDIDDNTTWSDEWKNLITNKIKKCNDISLDNDGKWILTAVE